MRNSIYTTLGASNHVSDERQKEDYYATDPIAIDMLLESGCQLSREVWECACGEGHLAKRLSEKGYSVYASDIVDRGYGKGNFDFLAYNELWNGDILTNPPYKYAQEFCEHALDVVSEGHKVLMFLKLQFLEGKGRKSLFDRGDLKTVYVSRSRIMCAKNGDFKGLKDSGGSAVAYAWFEFVKGNNGEPTIKWLKDVDNKGTRSLF